MQVAEQVSSIGLVEQSPHLEGRNMTMVLSPKKGAAASG
jgi:translation initiation factor IF-3